MGSYSYASVKQYVSYLRQKIEPDQLTQQPPDRRQPDAGRGDGGAAGANILSKLNVRSRVEVAVWAIEHDSAAARSGERTRS